MEYNVGIQSSLENYMTDDINKYVQTGFSVLDRSNAIESIGAKQNNFVWEYGYFMNNNISIAQLMSV
jgi:hypothetical protein